DAVVAVSDIAADSALSFGVEVKRLSVIPNGVDLARIRRLAAEPNPFSNSGPTVLGIGRLIDAKGFDILIRAHAQVIPRGPPHELAILGDGPRRADLARLAGRLGVTDTVKLPGFLANPYSALSG